MRRIEWGRFGGIRVKLFASMFGLCLLLFLGMLYTGMQNSRQVLIEQKSEDMSVLVERTGQFLDIYLQNISGILYSIINSEGFLSGTDESILQVLRRHIDASPNIVSQLFYLDKDGKVTASDPLAFDIIGHPHLRSLFDLAMNNPDLILWSQPYYSPLLAGNTVAFSLVVRDRNGVNTGLMIAEINLTRLSQQLSSFFTGQNQTFVILNERGEVLSYDKRSTFIPIDRKEYHQPIEAGFALSLSRLSNGIQSLDGEFRDKLAVRSNNNRLGWSIIALTDARVFQDGIRRLQQPFLLIGAVSLLLLLALTWGISRAFTRPIKLLALQMDRIRAERLIARVKTIDRSDEIGQLSRSFDALMARIQELMEQQLRTEERKKRVELKMLMSQIRPHFLYNTLNGIGNLARLNRNQEVQETIRSLIRLLTFSIDKQEDQVTLGEELACLEAYVQIQNVRYGGKIRLDVEVSEADRRCLVPKLLLQPLVENAIFHGLGRRLRGTVVVRALAHEDGLSLFVIDDGEGLDVERLKALLARSREAEGDDADRKGFNHIGLINVQERVRLLYGEPYGLYFEPQPKHGAEIEVRLPHLAEEQAAG